jgi:hypothetical protein
VGENGQTGKFGGGFHSWAVHDGLRKQRLEIHGGNLKLSRNSLLKSRLAIDTIEFLPLKSAVSTELSKNWVD